MPTSAPRSTLALALLLLTAAACGDDGGGASTTGSTSTTDATTGADTATSSATSSTTGGSDATAAPTSGTATAGTADASTTASTSASTTGGEEALPPTDSAELLEQWLAAGNYRDWPAESQVHASEGPHGGNVRTYINDALAESLAGAAAMHPQGAATVKELYGGGTDTIVGYAVMVKLAPDSESGDGWYWYERLNATVYADGTGVGLCTSCHVGGADYILTPYPLQ
jgi:hypothetical protein